MSQDKDILHLRSEAWTAVRELTGGLRKIIGPEEVSMIAKTPFSAMVAREALMYRLAEFVRGACDALDAGNVMVGQALVRVALETTGALVYLCGVVEKARSNFDFDRFHRKTMRILLGSNDPTAKHKPIHVNDMVEIAAKLHPVFKLAYDQLSEIAHPNHAGTLRSYSRADREKVWTEFGAYMHDMRAEERSALIGVLAMIETARDAYRRIDLALPAVATLCEQAIGAASGVAE